MKINYYKINGKSLKSFVEEVEKTLQRDGCETIEAHNK